MKNVMVDLETLGTVPGCIILSIGAVLFDEVSVGEGGFYRVVSKTSSEEAGLHECENTRAWWMKQGEEARRVLHEAENPHMALTLKSALEEFNDFLPTGALVFGNGADFDNALLSAAYRAAGVKPGWAPYNGRCYRTIKQQFREFKMERSGTHHNALDDARSQAEHLVRICRGRGWKLC